MTKGASRTQYLHKTWRRSVSCGSPRSRHESQIHADMIGLRLLYISSTSICRMMSMTGTKLRRAALLSTAVMLAAMVTPFVAASAFSGQITCLTPTSCANSQTINLSGAGSSATATLFLSAGSAASGTTINYYVCPQSASSCSSTSGSDNGWSWTFTPSSGTTGTGAGCSASSCEGNGIGSPSALSLSITAPSTVTSSNMQEDLTIYACSSSGSTSDCAGIYQQVASLTVTSNVPQFGLGVGVAMAVGLLGLVLVRKKSSTPIISAPAVA